MSTFDELEYIKPERELTSDDIIDMADVCPQQALPEVFSHDMHETDLSFYPTEPLDLKPEKIDYYYEKDVNENNSLLDLSAGLKQEIPSNDTTDMLSWTQKHPQNWSTLEVLDWLYFVADAEELDVGKLRGENFQNVTGNQICKMSVEEFQERDPEYGQLFYILFKKLLEDAKFSPPQPINYNEDYSCTKYGDIVSVLLRQEEMETDSETSQMLDNILPTIFDASGTQKVNINGEWYDFEADVSEFLMPSESSSSDPGYISAGDSSDTGSEIGQNERSFSVASSVFSDDDTMTSFIPAKQTKCKNQSRKRNSSSMSTDSGIGDCLETSEKKPKGNRGRKVGQSSKGNHLWEFIRDLLKDNAFNPTLLRWEDKESGVFRFVQSEAVAQMWGRKKNNKSMTYEKLSRAMRFCRTAGYFADVPKNGKFPKKLCFRFGQKAYGWREL